MEKFLIVSSIVAFVLLVLGCMALVAMIWAVGRMHLQRNLEDKPLITDEGPDLHKKMPEFAGYDREGNLIHSAINYEREQILLLLSATCSPCRQLMKVLKAVQHDIPYRPEFIVVLEGTDQDIVHAVDHYKLECPVIHDSASTIRTSLGVERTPYGFLIDQQGILRMKGVINNRSQLESLIRRRGHYYGHPIQHTLDDLATASIE